MNSSSYEMPYYVRVWVWTRFQNQRFLQSKHGGATEKRLVHRQVVGAHERMLEEPKAMSKGAKGGGGRDWGKNKGNRGCSVVFCSTMIHGAACVCSMREASCGMRGNGESTCRVLDLLLPSYSSLCNLQ